MSNQQEFKYINEEQALSFIAGCKAHFNDRQLDFVDKPRPPAYRQCTDIYCLFVFIIIILGFFAYSSFSIYTLFQNGMTTLNPNDQITFLKDVSQVQFQKLGIICAACIGGSVFIGLIVFLALKFFPYVTVHFMAFATSGVILAFGVVEMVTIKSGAGQYFLTVAVCYVGMVIGFCSNLEQSSILMKTVGNFIGSNLKILLVLFFAILYCGIILALWLGGFYSFCTRYSYGDLSFQGFAISFGFWIFMLIFLNFYFYYTTVFITSNAIAIWFFDKTEQFDIVTSPFKIMARFHLGTITFASLAITFIKIFNFIFILSRLKKIQCPIPRFIGLFAFCFVRFCCGVLEAFVEVINNNAIIICSLTGQDLIDSSKVVGQFFFNDKKSVFSNFTITTYITNIGGVLTISIIPTFIGGILTNFINGPLWAISVMIIFFTSFMIGLIILQIFVESASTLFLLYVLDGKLSEEGLNVVWIDKFAGELQKGFDEAFVGKLEKNKIKTKTITTVVVHGNGMVETYKENLEYVENDRTLEQLQNPRPFGHMSTM